MATTNPAPLILTLGLSLLLSASSQSWAASHDHKHEHKAGKKHHHKDTQASAKKIGKDKVLIKVKGMVCAFCAQGIKKNFNAREEVKETKVDLDKMEVHIELKKNKTISEEVIKELVTSAGFSYEGMH